MLIPLFCGLLLNSCQDKEEETYFDFDGDLETVETLPSYANPGDVIHVTPYGITKDPDDPDNPTITYSFMYTPGMTKRDTMKTFIISVPDTLCTSKIQVFASAPGYNTYTSEYTIAIIDPDKSLTNVTHDPEGGTFTDPRDSRKYLHDQINIHIPESDAENIFPQIFQNDCRQTCQSPAQNKFSDQPARFRFDPVHRIDLLCEIDRRNHRG